MLDEKDLQAVAQIIDVKLDRALDKKLDEKLQPIHARLDFMDARLDRMASRMDSAETCFSRMQDDIDILKENSAVTRSATNALVAWAEKAEAQVEVPFLKNV